MGLTSAGCVSFANPRFLFEYIRCITTTQSLFFSLLCVLFPLTTYGNTSRFRARCWWRLRDLLRTGVCLGQGLNGVHIDEAGAGLLMRELEVSYVGSPFLAKARLWTIVVFCANTNLRRFSRAAKSSFSLFCIKAGGIACLDHPVF